MPSASTVAIDRWIAMMGHDGATVLHWLGVAANTDFETLMKTFRRLSFRLWPALPACLAVMWYVRWDRSLIENLVGSGVAGATWLATVGIVAMVTSWQQQSSPAKT